MDQSQQRSASSRRWSLTGHRGGAQCQGAALLSRPSAFAAQPDLPALQQTRHNMTSQRHSRLSVSSIVDSLKSGCGCAQCQRLQDGEELSHSWKFKAPHDASLQICTPASVISALAGAASEVPTAFCWASFGLAACLLVSAGCSPFCTRGVPNFCALCLRFSASSYTREDLLV